MLKKITGGYSVVLLVVICLLSILIEDTISFPTHSYWEKKTGDCYSISPPEGYYGPYITYCGEYMEFTYLGNSTLPGHPDEATPGHGLHPYEIIIYEPTGPDKYVWVCRDCNY